MIICELRTYCTENECNIWLDQNLKGLHVMNVTESAAHSAGTLAHCVLFVLFEIIREKVQWNTVTDSEEGGGGGGGSKLNCSNSDTNCQIVGI